MITPQLKMELCTQVLVSIGVCSVMSSAGTRGAKTHQGHHGTGAGRDRIDTKGLTFSV